MLAQDLEALLQLYGEEIKVAMQKRLKADNKYATGKAHNELIARATPNSLTIEGWKYIEVISGGRQPGKKAPPVSKIMQWMDARKIKAKKGRTRSLAYIIAKRIGEKGIKGNNMLTEIKNQFLPRMDQDIADVVQDEITRITSKLNTQTKNG